jgi:hypothetical protein
VFQGTLAEVPCPWYRDDHHEGRQVSAAMAHSLLSKPLPAWSPLNRQEGGIDSRSRDLKNAYPTGRSRSCSK